MAPLGKYTKAMRTGEPVVDEANAAPVSVSAAFTTPGNSDSNAGSATQRAEAAQKAATIKTGRLPERLGGGIAL